MAGQAKLTPHALETRFMASALDLTFRSFR